MTLTFVPDYARRLAANDIIRLSKPEMFREIGRDKLFASVCTELGIKYDQIEAIEIFMDNTGQTKSCVATSEEDGGYFTIGDYIDHVKSKGFHNLLNISVVNQFTINKLNQFIISYFL